MEKLVEELIEELKGGYAIVHADGTDDEIINFYETLNSHIGVVQKADDLKYTNIINDVWVNIKYDSESEKPWETDDILKLHTDNSRNYANLTQLVCLEAAPFSGHTTLIKNERVVELIKFWDSYKKTNLFDKILNLEVTFPEFIGPILRIENGKYIFCFNHAKLMKTELDEEKRKIICELDDFLHNKIFLSNLMTEIKLDRGDALIFNDEDMIHGRRSILGDRHYIKCSILMSPNEKFTKKLNTAS